MEKRTIVNVEKESIMDEIFKEEVEEKEEKKVLLDNSDMILETEMPEPAVEGISKDSDDEPKPKKRGRKPKAVSEEPVVIESKGTYSEDIVERQMSMKTKQEKLNEEFQKLANARRNHALLWGTLEKVGTEIMNDKEMAFAYVDFNDIEVKIPADLYFEPTYNFGTTYESSSPRKKEARKHQNLRYQLGATVCFIPISLRRDKFDGDEEETIICMGNRVEAMKTLREIYFLGDKPIVKPESIIDKCHVLAVRDMNVLVECCGVETKVTLYYTSYKQASVDSATQLYEAGDTVKAIVRTLKISGDNVKLGVSLRTEEALDHVKRMKVGQCFMGYVDSFNREKNSYTIVDRHGVKCAVKAENVQGGLALSIGDKVSVVVTNKYKTHVAGICKKI